MHNRVHPEPTPATTTPRASTTTSPPLPFPLTGMSFPPSAFSPSAPPAAGGGAEIQLAAPATGNNAQGAPSFVPRDEIEDHIVRPNAFCVADIVKCINGHHGSSAASCGCGDVLCCLVCGPFGLSQLCCGRLFNTGVGIIDLWLDGNKQPYALDSNQWQFRPNFLHSHLGQYDMTNPKPFSSDGVCVCKIETGSVYFANKGGQPVMIAAHDKPGWFVTTEPGFSFANQVEVEGRLIYDSMAKLACAYIHFESLHLFNVQPNTVHVVSNYIPGIGNQWQILPPGSHSFSSPFMKSTAVIPTSIQDVTITEDRVSTQDGVLLTNCRAVLSYQIRIGNVKKLLELDVANYSHIIADWAKRTMLHEISCMDYQTHQPLSSPPGQYGADDGDDDEHKGGILGRRRPKPAAPGSAGSTGGSDDSNEGFRPTLEHHMRRSLQLSLEPYGVDVKTFALQSFDPPAALASQVTNALARRTEAQYQFQAAQVQNQTLIARADAEATAIQTRAAAVARAAELTASVPHARLLQILDKQVEIARAWSNGAATTLVLGSGMPGAGAPHNIAGPSAEVMPFASLKDLQASTEGANAHSQAQPNRR